MGSQAPPPPVVQALTQKTLSTLSLSQLVTIPMVFNHIPKNQFCCSFSVAILAISNFFLQYYVVKGGIMGRPNESTTFSPLLPLLCIISIPCPPASITHLPSHSLYCHFSLHFLYFNHHYTTLTHTPFPNTGLLQFQPSPPGEGLISPALEPAHITVLEEAGQIHLPVARAQGLLGRVMIGYRTTPFTASSPEDYEVGFH